MSPLLGGGGANTMFVDAEARHDFGGGWSTALTARRGWTEFTGGRFQTGAYGFDLAKVGVLSNRDSIAFRLAQPLRVEHGGLAMMLPTSYDYYSQRAAETLGQMSLIPSGREIDAELSYGSTLWRGKAWLGGNLFYRRQPGHIAAAPGDPGAAIRFSLGF